MRALQKQLLELGVLRMCALADASSLLAKSLRRLHSHWPDDRGKETKKLLLQCSLEHVSNICSICSTLSSVAKAAMDGLRRSATCWFWGVVVVVLLRAGILFFSLQVKARSGAEMDRRLQWWDMIALGVGGMMGAGIFISTGIAARDYAGPAVVVSYLVAGISALLSAFCYTEFAVEMPVAGGAFSYLQITFGAQVLAHLLSCS